jgi:hypothetical protein
MLSDIIPVLSMCVLMRPILVPCEYQKSHSRATCIGCHQNSNVKGDEKDGSHICWKEWLRTRWLRSGNCLSGIRRGILRACLDIRCHPNHLARHDYNMYYKDIGMQDEKEKWNQIKVNDIVIKTWITRISMSHLGIFIISWSNRIDTIRCHKRLPSR